MVYKQYNVYSKIQRKLYEYTRAVTFCETVAGMEIANTRKRNR